MRRTVVVHGRLAMRELRLEAARGRLHGLQVITFEQLAARLAGGMSQVIDDEALRAAVQQALSVTPLGELDAIKDLPGMVGAAADTLRKVWRSGIDVQARRGGHARLASVARLEEAVLALLPPAMMRPPDLVAAAIQRLRHAKVLFGPIEIVGITELSPVWRVLLKALAEHIEIRWKAGPRAVPPWLSGSAVVIERVAPQAPQLVAVSAATAYHEAVEAMRWARQLVASGQAVPAEIAIASVNPADYDDYFLALRADANIDLHFAHGINVTACREGQAAAALADILDRGLSQTRMRRLTSLLAAYPGPFEELPRGWIHLLPADAPLESIKAWLRLIDRLEAGDWPDGKHHGPALRNIVELLAKGTVVAAQAGDTLLRARARTIWRKALLAGPAASLDLTLAALKQDDGHEPSVSIAWMPASALAASPRPFVRLLGLNSSRWPRPISEDRILSDHIIPSAELDPLPAGAADRRDYETILATTEREVVLSRARRDSEGRLLGRSALLRGTSEAYLARNRVPGHAFSEMDRLMARPAEFRGTAQAAQAVSCWRDWQRTVITAHDGLVRAGHPLIAAILDRVQSAHSLQLLLRNPLGFVWCYGFDWSAPESGHDPLMIDAMAMGSLVHLVLDGALTKLEAGGGFAAAAAEQIAAAVEIASSEAAQAWELDMAVPPKIIWRRTVNEARDLSGRALSFGNREPGARHYGEVPFGGSKAKSQNALPWDATVPVEIPGTGFRINGYIDRLEISADGRRVLVRDYKTGKTPVDAIVLNGGRELQRCLYAFAAKAMLGDHVEVSASLFYPRDETDLPLADPAATLTEMAGYLQAARHSFAQGASIVGIDTGGDYDDLAFALPANAKASYCPRKTDAATEKVGPAAKIWDAP